jgi:serine/threonine protein kinase
LVHKHIVKLFHAFVEGKQFIMIMEAALGGELFQYLNKHKTMPEPQARRIILQVVQAMLYCHSRGIVHRDLKLENVLFKYQDQRDLEVKVVDFGIAGVASEDKVDAGTLAYMAPECLDDKAADTTPAIDVWAIGVMFFALIFGHLPFYSEKESELVRIIKHEPVKFPLTHPISTLSKAVIEQML